MKRMLTFVVICLSSMMLLTGCVGIFEPTGPDGRDKSVPTDEVITKQIKDILKVEMDKIGFTVDLEQYGFTVTIPQTYATGGTVYLNDPLYEHSGVPIYKGDFVNIEKEKVALNPVNFIVEKYQDYLLTKYKTNLEQAEAYLTSVGVEAERNHFRTGEYDTIKMVYPVDSEISNGRPIKLGGSYMFVAGEKVTDTEYISYFKNKSASTMDMADFHQVMKYNAQFYYIAPEEIDTATILLAREELKKNETNKLFITIS